MPTSDLVSASALGPLTKKKDNIAELLLSDEKGELEKLTELYKGEPAIFAKALWVLRTTENLKKAKSWDDFEPIPLVEIPLDILRFREAIEGRRADKLINVSRIHVVQEEEKKEKKKGIFAWLRR